MNPHAESLRHLAPRLNDANRSIDGPTLLDAAREIERLEAELAQSKDQFESADKEVAIMRSELGMSINERNRLCAELNAIGNLTADRLAGLLVKRGVIHEAAVADPDGYDGGITEDAINAVVSELKGNP